MKPHIPGAPTRSGLQGFTQLRGGWTCVALLFVLGLFPLAHFGKQRASSSGLIVHEWGTFTSIAGEDGRAMDWLPLTGSTELPSFVEHLRTPQFKGGVRGTVRMETPVLYFYTPSEVTVSVKVAFAQGFITEWYPHATAGSQNDPRKVVSLYDKLSAGGITWDSVHVEPRGATDFPQDEGANPYYAARATLAAPICVATPAGDQQERFLFYRGVSSIVPPLFATLSTHGDVTLKREVPGEFSSVILFERRGDRIGYRSLGALEDQTSLAWPSLDGSMDSLLDQMEGILISQGLFPDEAHAMIETWKGSWFEEGSRVFYLVPRSFVDKVVPLSIHPAADETVRVFVGRMELVTPATQQAVEAAFASGDRVTLAKYARFLEPILRQMLAHESDPARTLRLQGFLNSASRGLN